MRIHNLAISDLVASLHTTIDGLTSPEAKRRLIEFGPNAIAEEKGKPLFLKFLRGFTHFFAVILWCGAAIAFIAESMAPGGGMNLIGYAILAVIFINAVFSFWQEYKAEQAIAALRKLIPHTVKVFRDFVLTTVPAGEIVPGDLIFLEEGDDVPGDSRLIDAVGMRVNNATLTGESIPQSRGASDSAVEEVMHSANVVLAGTSVFTGHGKALVFATGMRSEFGKIAGMTQAAEESLSPLQHEIVRLSRVIAALAIGVGILFLFVGKAMGISFWTNIVLALGIIVALVPEGLLPEVTLALATCSQRMARRNALIRHLPSVETLGSASVICTDKTGTLTQNKMSVCELYFCGEQLREPQCASLSTPNQEALVELCMVALNCENTREVVKEGRSSLVGDPMEIALVDFARRTSPESRLLDRIDDLPFDSERKRVTTIHKLDPSHFVIYSKGALEQLIPHCKMVRTRSGLCELTDNWRQDFIAAQESMTSRGLRVIAACYRTFTGDYVRDDVEADLVLVGLFGLEDPPRPEVPAALARCKQAGIRVLMITGDHPNTAQAIARQIGLIDASTNISLVTGPALRKMSETQLELMLSRGEVIFARTDADQKMRIVLALKRLGHIVAVTGDGVNDAPALKAADIGVAMGLTGTDVARAAADMVLADDNFASIVNAIEEGRAVFSNIRKFLTYVLSSNIAELLPYLAFAIFNLPLPLTVMQVLSVDLCADILPALALGSEPPESESMLRPPRSRRDGLFDGMLLARAYLYLGVMVSAASMVGYLWVLRSNGWQWGQNLGMDEPLCMMAQTACLVGIMAMQTVNAFLCRSDRKSLFAQGVFSNKLLNIAIIIHVLLILIIVYSPAAHTLFHTASLPWQYWLLIAPCMLTMLVVEEFRKLIVRKRDSRHGRAQPSSADKVMQSLHPQQQNNGQQLLQVAAKVRPGKET